LKHATAYNTASLIPAVHWPPDRARLARCNRSRLLLVVQCLYAVAHYRLYQHVGQITFPAPKDLRCNNAISSSVSAACRYMLSRTAAVTEELRAAYENYQFARFYQASAGSCYVVGSMCCCKCEDTGSGLPAYVWQHTMCMLRQAVQRFAVTELSNFYLDVAKDRLYVRSASSPDRRY
jgi:isoleucyl-tRNA synthetase